MATEAQGKRRIRKVLAANRGEIAGRILRACRTAGIESVAVYSEADSEAPYLSLADQVTCIGPGPAAESYLNIDHILSAAQRSGADAIHPGYGFLSENAEFAERCNAAGITFIGPSASSIRALGDKAGAKRLAVQAGVPVVAGYYGDDQADQRLLAEAALLGAPLLIKATAGGGGRGMRVVRDLAHFSVLLREARQEANVAFGNDAVLLERYVVRPRHIEVQIFGDAGGRVFAVHERECSIQRRQQKIVEESPSPGLDAALRAAMQDAAVRIGQAASYQGAGTVEFLLDESNAVKQFYFLEVNTRLQVEHPVTEARTGLDLVRLQIDIAEGRPTPLLTTRIPAIGHAIEARICAEDPAHGFAPSLGTLTVWREPSGPGVRVDSGVARGSEVTPYYDSMLAKLIVHAPTRSQAIERMDAALTEFDVVGVTTNISYLLSIVRDEAFRSGNTHIQFLEERLAGWRPPARVPDEVLLALAAEMLTQRRDSSAGTQRMASDGSTTRHESPWHDTGAWRNA